MSLPIETRTNHPIEVSLVSQEAARFVWAFHLPGTLAANANIRWAIPASCHVEHISAVAANDSDATITFGISTDTDSILTSSAIGDSNVPAEFEAADWAVTNEEGALVDGQIAVLTLDFDGASGTAAVGVTLIVTATVD